MNYLERRECSQKIYAPQKFFYIFSLKLNLSFLVSHEADNITIQRATKRAHPRKSLPVYLNKYIYIHNICTKIYFHCFVNVCGLFIHT